MPYAALIDTGAYGTAPSPVGGATAGATRARHENWPAGAAAHARSNGTTAAALVAAVAVATTLTAHASAAPTTESTRARSAIVSPGRRAPPDPRRRHRRPFQHKCRVPKEF